VAGSLDGRSESFAIKSNEAVWRRTRRLEVVCVELRDRMRRCTSDAGFFHERARFFAAVRLFWNQILMFFKSLKGK
jgi:hypothetical protein